MIRGYQDLVLKHYHLGEDKGFKELLLCGGLWKLLLLVGLFGAVFLFGEQSF